VCEKIVLYGIRTLPPLGDFRYTLILIHVLSRGVNVSVIVKEHELFDACRVLFGPDIHLSHEFLDYLQTSGARSAYRRRAKEVHPDLVAGEDELLRKEHARLFRQLAEAFELVTGFLESRVMLPRDESPTKKAADHEAPRPRHAPPRREERSGYYRGGIPARPLEIGLYLYYRGAISYHELLQALLWQRKQRPSIGSIARRWGWLSAEDVTTVLRGREVGRFGDRAIGMDLLTPFQVQTLLYFQRCRQKRLGDYFTEHRILTCAQMDRLVSDLENHNRTFRTRTPRGQSRRAAV